MKKFFAVLTALLLAANIAMAEEVRLDIYSVNDWHGYLREDKNVPGAARLDFALAGLMADNPEGALLLGGGDMLAGSTDANEFNGMSVVDAMNEMGFAANCAGNHAFDYDFDVIRQQAAAAKFPILAANIIDSRTGRIAEPFIPYTVVERRGVKIGVIGILGQEALQKIKPERINGLWIANPAEAVNKYAAGLKAAGADIIVLLAHIGCTQEGDAISGPIEPVLKEIQGLDAVITADSHTVVAGRLYGLPVVQAGEYGKLIGHISLDYDTEKKKVTAAKPGVYDVKSLPPGKNEKLAALLQPYFDKADARYNRVLAYNEQELTNDKYGASPAGDYFTGLLKTELKTDIALYNGGAVRSGLPAGKVTLRMLKQVFPFNNTLYVVRLKGSDIIAALEHGIGNPQMGQLRFAGLSVTAKKHPQGGSKIKQARLADGSLLQPDKYYSTVVNDFMLEGGDGYSSLKNAKNKYPVGNDLELLAAALTKIETIKFSGDNRLVLE